MRKKELRKKIEYLKDDVSYWKKKHEAEQAIKIEKELKDIPEMDVTHCELCGTKKLTKDMNKYKRKWRDGWNIFYVCKECSKKNN